MVANLRDLLYYQLTPAEADLVELMDGTRTIAGLFAIVSVVQSHRFTLSAESVGVGFVVLLTLNVLIVLIHEMGHAAVLVHYGRRVKSAGFRIYFGSPSFFIESSDGLMLDR